MLKNIFIKPWVIYRKAFLVFFILGLIQIDAQNTLTKKLSADSIKTISINGNQIFNIAIMTTKSNNISISSTLDGEYQNNYQIATQQEIDELKLGLEYMSFDEIPDDKRNAHKVIAATLFVEIPHNLNINIFSDVGSVYLEGNFNALNIELLQGNCGIIGLSTDAIVNTIDGNITIVTKRGRIEAISSNGKVDIDEFDFYDNVWKLKSIDGNIRVAKKE